MSFSFPEKGMPKTEVLNLLSDIKQGQGVDSNTAFLFQRFSTTPHPVTLEALEMFAGLNYNNAGIHTTHSTRTRNSLQLCEREVIFMLGDLMGSTDIDGYVTQGGSEGNLMGLWVGRNLLRASKNAGKNVCLLKTRLTHFSVDKAADILDISKVEDIAFDNSHGMSADALGTKFKELSLQGWNKFLVLATLGYATTGAIDNMKAINSVIMSAQKSGLNIYVHVDAAIGGMVYPFVSSSTPYFKFESVKSISLDMHKTGFVPLTAGVFLCRRNLQKWVEKSKRGRSIQKDNTVSTTRPATAAVTCWSVIRALGKEGFREIVKYEFFLKDYFLRIHQKNKNIFSGDYIHAPQTNIVAFSISNSDERVEDFIRNECKLRLFKTIRNRSKTSFYTMIFMPHMKTKDIDQFVKTIASLRSSST